MRERLSRRGLWEGHMIANAFCPGDSAKHGLPEGKEVHRVGRGTEGKSPPPSQPHPLLLHPQPLSYEELFLFDEFNHSPARNETKGAEKARGMIKSKKNLQPLSMMS